MAITYQKEWTENGLEDVPYSFESNGKTYILVPNEDEAGSMDAMLRTYGRYGVGPDQIMVEPTTGRYGVEQGAKQAIDNIYIQKNQQGSIFDLGPLLLASFMVPAIASSLAAAGTGAAVAGVDAGLSAATSEFGGSLVTGAGEVGTVANAAVAGGATTGSGLIGSGVEAAGTGGAVAAPEATLSAGQEAAQSIAQEWGNYVDPWASGNAETVANSGVAGDMGLTVESAATRAGDITDLAKAPTPPSNTQDAARRLVQTAEDVTSAEAGSGAWKASSGAANDIWTKIWNGVTSPQGIGAAINTIGGAISGMGIAALNRDTMEKKSKLDLQNAEALQKFRTDQSRANMFRGLIGVRPAATRAPLRRLTGGPVYDGRGLIRRA